MFFSSFVALALATTVFASPRKRFDDLTVEVTGPPSVNSIDDLKFTAKVKNTGSEDVKVLKYATILDDLPTRSFTVTKDGANVPFTGIKLSVSVKDLDESSFVTIPAGETVTVKHDVASLFDFAAAGAGAYTFAPVTNFKVAGAEEEVPIVRASKIEAPANNAKVIITGDLTNRKIPVLDKRAVNICSNPVRRDFISASYGESRQLATRAISYINSNGTNALYKAYWGNNDPSSVISVLNAVATENSTTRTLSCTDPFRACRPGTIAYTLISTTNIHYCSIFFNEFPTSTLCSGTTVASRRVRGGTTLHELTHAVSDTDDVTYGCAADQALSDAQSIINADSYNCYTTQVFQDTKC